MHPTALMYLKRQKVNLNKMHSAAFYFYCTYTNGISLRIIIKDYITTQTLINETALNCGFNLVCNWKPKAAKAVSFSDIFWLLLCTQNNRKLTLVYRPILSTYMLYSNQLLVYQFNTLWDGHILMSSENYQRNTFWFKFTIDLFWGACTKTERHQTIWIIFLVA